MLLVRNLQAGPTVFSDRTSDTAIEWAGAGDLNGEDIQQVPESLIKDNINFARTLRRGVLEVVEADADTQALLDKQTESWRARGEATDEAAKASIDPAANNDIITLACVGPNNRGTGVCGEPVPTREKQKTDKPPLCPQHESLAGSFVLTQTGNTTGEPDTQWVRATTEPRERQQVP